jgi:pyrimidine operon attenuation protein / uracil phosphoribosyltransferase
MKEKKMKQIMSGREIDRAIDLIAKEIVAKTPKLNELVFIGILTRGVYIAQRLIRAIEGIKKHTVPLGTLDITFYRDDIDSIETQPLAKETKIMFDLTGKNVILVDDVLFTGRSIRAALDEIIDFGRPKQIRLAVLVDRGHRELPIQADFVGKAVTTEYAERIRVKLKEIDKTDTVVSTRG